jgi:hypothetical protein
MRYLIDGIAIGIGATLLMDLWNLFLKRAFGIPSLNYSFLGRWVLHIPDGTLFVAIMSRDWVARPTLTPALIYGIATVVFPFFILQPSLGLGIASASTANPTKARLKSLATHFVFGLGMYLTALVVSRVS